MKLLMLGGLSTEAFSLYSLSSSVCISLSGVHNELKENANDTTAPKLIAAEGIKHHASHST